MAFDMKGVLLHGEEDFQLFKGEHEASYLPATSSKVEETLCISQMSYSSISDYAWSTVFIF